MREHLRYIVKSYKALQKANPSTDEGLAWKCLLTHVTYRLDTHADRQPSIGFRVMWRTLKKINSGIDPLTPIDGGNPGHIILEAKVGRIEQKANYIARQHTHKPGYFVSKEDAPSWLKGQGIRLAYFIAVLPIALKCFFSRQHRANRALHILHIAELTALRWYFAKAQPEAIYDFCPYHVDSNWQYLVHREHTKSYFKLPSPGPLRTHNATTLCDVLVTSSGYHEDELPSLPEIRFVERKKWLVENAFNYIERYATKTLPEPPSGSIGFYSHGSWIRKASGHRDDGLNIHSAELQLLSDLAVILKENPHYRLIIFPHPREKKAEMLERTHAHYTALLKGTNYEMSDPTRSTADSFESVDVALAAFSTIVYERLFCGYKTLIGNYGISTFPIDGSPLNTICFQSKEQLVTLLSHLVASDREGFFAHHKLHHYRFDSYPYFRAKVNQ